MPRRWTPWQGAAIDLPPFKKSTFGVRIRGGRNQGRANRAPRKTEQVESFNGKLRDELLKRESFDTVLEAKVLVQRWRQDYNTIQPHTVGVIEGENLTSKKWCRTWGQVS